ncbi:molybdopterin-dependent oxidoreductase [Thermorudis peleae]|uniref:molybdopterin-dependent oxidoreductase n=1 Tax=Thermorudis peleae TaxID=1382356 RepID=UPI00068B8193|nr:molybdopterin-dependent oxidoreductase [Thermorudis peleae]MBX6754996.1 molybdopterin-dependent oxidoreductase [Thermorudis peleae]
MRSRLIVALLMFVLTACNTAVTPTPGATPRSAAGTSPTVVQPTATPTVSTPTAQRSTPTSGDTLTITGLVKQPGQLTPDQAKQLGSETVAVQFVSSKGTEEHRYTGVRLWAVLQQVGLQLDSTRKNDELRKYVVVTGRDGYEVVLSLGELDPNFGNRPVLLAWDEDGTPLSGDRGPFRLVVPGDQRGGRYVSGVIKLEVRDIDSPPRSR